MLRHSSSVLDPDSQEAKEPGQPGLGTTVWAHIRPWRLGTGPAWGCRAQCLALSGREPERALRDGITPPPIDGEPSGGKRALQWFGLGRGVAPRGRARSAIP